MKAWGIVPVKELKKAKSSLAPFLDEDERRGLVLSMLSDVLRAMLSSGALEGVVVVSPDETVLEHAEREGATSLLEPGLGLNGAVELAIEFTAGNGASVAVVFPADLPLLGEEDVRMIVAMASEEKVVVIAPSKSNGTNALLLRPPDVIEPRFGGESFPVHLREAALRKLPVKVYRSPAVAFDVDSPSDLFYVAENGPRTMTAEFLKNRKIMSNDIKLRANGYRVLR